MRSSLTTMELHLLKFLVTTLIGLTICAVLISDALKSRSVDCDTTTYANHITVAEAALRATGARVITAVKPSVSSQEATMLAQLVWHEARYVSTEEQAAVMWCALNRVDSDNPLFPDTLYGVLTQPGQFEGYQPEYPVDPELYELACDVLARHSLEQQGVRNVGRTLPPNYYWYHGDGYENYFRTSFNDFSQPYRWTLPDPYETADPSYDIIYL